MELLGRVKLVIEDRNEMVLESAVLGGSATELVKGSGGEVSASLSDQCARVRIISAGGRTTIEDVSRESKMSRIRAALSIKRTSTAVTTLPTIRDEDCNPAKGCSWTKSPLMKPTVARLSAVLTVSASALARTSRRRRVRNRFCASTVVGTVTRDSHQARVPKKSKERSPKAAAVEATACKPDWSEAEEAAAMRARNATSGILATRVRPIAVHSVTRGMDIFEMAAIL